jgi:hypothetical protein
MIQVSDALTPEAKAIIRALQAGTFTYRSISGLSKDAQLDASSTQMAVNRLVVSGLVDQIPTEKGLRFYLTRGGRAAALGMDQAK